MTTCYLIWYESYPLIVTDYNIHLDSMVRSVDPGIETRLKQTFTSRMSGTRSSALSTNLQILRKKFPLFILSIFFDPVQLCQRRGKTFAKKTRTTRFRGFVRRNFFYKNNQMNHSKWESGLYRREQPSTDGPLVQTLESQATATRWRFDCRHPPGTFVI